MNIRPDLSTLMSVQKDALILALWDRLDKLEAVLLKNSSTASEPPSSDGFKRKPNSRRVAGKASVSGQKGHPGAGAAVPKGIAATYRRQYRRLLAQARQVNPKIRTDPTRKDRRGGIKRSFALNLIRRLDERDIRMLKLKQKVSGCYRSSAGAQAYCSIRSYLGTLQKRSADLMQALTTLFTGHMPAAG